VIERLFTHALRILSIDFRELAPERLEVGQKDKDGWTCIFNGRDLEGWEVLSEKQSIESGALVIENKARLRRRGTVADFELRGSVQMRSAAANTDIGVGALVFRQPNDPEWLFSVKLHSAGNTCLFARQEIVGRSTGPKIPWNTWQPFTFRVAATVASLEMDHKPVLTGPVPIRQSGFVELYCYSEGKIAFKDLWLRELGPDGKPVGGAQTAPANPAR
jgi:hypothetical protein